MMQQLSLQVQTILKASRLFAALRKSFEPAELIAAVVGDARLSDPVLMVEVLSLLRDDCQVDGEVWTMRPGPRRKVLAAQQDYSTAEPGTDQTDVQQALAGTGDFAPDRLAALIAKPDRAALTRILETIDQAGPDAPGFAQLVALRAALNTAQQSKRNDDILATGFFGREAALKGLDRWIGSPQVKPPLRTWHISGIPGMGKSYMLEKVIQSARARHQPILIRLDFDRLALNILNPHGLCDEVSRQMADAVPEAASKLRKLRAQSADARAGLDPAQLRRHMPRALLRGIADIANGTDRVVLIVLDGLDQLRSHGETHISRLFGYLDYLVVHGLRSVTVISAGGGDVFALTPYRMLEHTILSGLEDSAARALLKKEGVSPDLWPRILPLAQGNPLLLKLAGRAITDAATDDDDFPVDADATQMGTYLFRSILSQLSPALRSLSKFGLILRVIDLEVLQNIVAPVLGFTLSKEEAGQLLLYLRTHDWLVAPDHNDALRYRSDMRWAFLDLVYADDPKTASAINRAAAKWFKARNPVEALYHELQLVRVGVRIPRIEPEKAAAFPAQWLDDLPDLSRDAMLQAQGNRSGFGRVGSAVPSPDAPAGKTLPPDRRAVTDLETMLKRGDIPEATFIVEHCFAASLDARGHAGVLILCQQWQAGRWTTVRRLWKKLGLAALERTLANKDHTCGRLLLEIAAEFDFDALVAYLRRPALSDFTRSLIDVPLSFAPPSGALDFAALVAFGAGEADGARPRAVAVLANHLNIEDDHLKLLAIAQADRVRDRFDLHLTEDERSAIAALMPLNPYAAFLAARIKTSAVAAELLTGSDIGRLAKVFAPAIDGTIQEALPTVVDKIEAIEALGLTAEWIMGLSTAHTTQDWPWIAAAAERWRRTVAGTWSYGQPPAGWRGRTDGADDGAVAVVDHMIMQDNPVAAARDALLFWNAAPKRLRQRFEKRYIETVRAGLPGKNDSVRAAALSALDTLQRSQVPMIVAAPLAVLAAHGIDLDKEI